MGDTPSLAKSQGLSGQKISSKKKMVQVDRQIISSILEKLSCTDFSESNLQWISNLQ